MDFRFCPACGNALGSCEQGDRARPCCPYCGFVQYKNPTVGVAVILLDPEGRILLGRRVGSFEGDWCIPCGHVEWDEDVRQAAVREFAEETGLTVRLQRVYDVHSNFHDPDHPTVGIWFLGEAVSGTLSPGSDLSRATFFALDDLPPNMAFPTDLLICQRLLNERKS